MVPRAIYGPSTTKWEHQANICFTFLITGQFPSMKILLENMVAFLQLTSFSAPFFEIAMFATAFAAPPNSFWVSKCFQFVWDFLYKRMLIRVSDVLS